MPGFTNPFVRNGRDALIVEALRTPMGRSHPERGWFRDTHPNEMLGAVYTALLASTGLAPDVVEDLVIGCTAPFGEQSRNVARKAWFQAGYPPEVPATVLDRRCGSVLRTWHEVSPSGPSSRPIPPALMPPNGAKGSLM